MRDMVDEALATSDAGYWLGTSDAQNDRAFVSQTQAERKAFEEWVLRFCNASIDRRFDNGKGVVLYADDTVQAYWHAWIGRANMRCGLLLDR